MNGPVQIVFNGDWVQSYQNVNNAVFATVNGVQRFWMSAFWGMGVHDTIVVLKKINPFLAPFLPDVPMYLDEPKKVAGGN